jgi:predicted enzyme related to lactoylglutathione lyase
MEATTHSPGSFCTSVLRARDQNSIFSVEDCDATLSHALQLGACEDYVHTVPKAGRIGVFRDPDRALFLVRGPVPA